MKHPVVTEQHPDSGKTLISIVADGPVPSSDASLCGSHD